MAPVQGFAAGIPWSMHLRAYDAYRKKYGEQKALIDLEGRNCRGGFGTEELDDFIPGWREELSELARLRDQVRRAALQIVLLCRQLPRDNDRRESALEWLNREGVMPDVYRQSLEVDPIALGM